MERMSDGDVAAMAFGAGVLTIATGIAVGLGYLLFRLLVA